MHPLSSLRWPPFSERRKMHILYLQHGSLLCPTNVLHIFAPNRLGGNYFPLYEDSTTIMHTCLNLIQVTKHTHSTTLTQNTVSLRGK